MDMPASLSFCWHLLTSADICWHMLTFADSCWHLLIVADSCWWERIVQVQKFYGYDDICWRLLTFADIYWHLLTLADVCWHLLTFADVCWHLLTFADICWHLLTFADVCWTLPGQTIQQFSWNALITPAGHWLARTSLGYRISVPKRAWAGPSSRIYSKINPTGCSQNEKGTETKSVRY